MKQLWLLLIAFGLLNIAFPDLLAYLLGGFFVVAGFSLFLTDYRLGKQKKNEEQFVKFGNFKIYR